MKQYRVEEPEFGSDILAGLRRPKDEAALRDAAADAAVEIEHLRGLLSEAIDCIPIGDERGNPYERERDIIRRAEKLLSNGQGTPAPDLTGGRDG